MSHPESPSKQPREQVRIFDTTLRDGEQSPGATMTSAEKLEVARALSRLGVDVIEAGFPAASPDDLAAVSRIAETVGHDVPEGRISPQPPIICGLARATESDIEAAHRAVRGARRPRIHTFLATSPVHREHKLRLSCAQVVERAARMVRFARALCEDIEFSAEDACRTEQAFLEEVVAAVIEAGATTINIPDTVGYTTPDEISNRIRSIIDNVRGARDVIISVHCHNDLGLATANSLAGVAAGARQVEVAVNGIGERAGNTSLEEVVMALATRKDRFGIGTAIDSTWLCRTSKLVSMVTGMVVQPNKAIVGANAFAHEAGIHQDGMLKHEETYEIMRPESVGAGRTRLVLGKHSGRHAFAVRLRELGYLLEGPELEQAFSAFKDLADKKKAVTDADLEALVGSGFADVADLWTLDALQVGCGTTGLSTATVRIRDRQGAVRTQAAVGTGPVDAAFKAIAQITSASATLLEYSVQAVTEGIDALGRVSVRIQPEGGQARPNPQHDPTEARVFHGNGADTDIIVASARAYLTAINRMQTAMNEGAPSPGDQRASEAAE